MICIDEHETVVDVDRAQWDRLAGDDVFSTYGWLRTVEETSLVTRRFRYFAARASGELVGAAACYLDEGSAAVSAEIDRMLYGRLVSPARWLRLTVSPALVCGSRTGLSGHILVHRDVQPRERERVTLHVLEAMEETARRSGWTLGFRNVAAGSGALVEILRTRGYARAAELPTTFLDVRWKSFDGYRRALKADHPATAKNIPWEINRARKNGLVFEKLADPVSLERQLYGLLRSHHERLNGRLLPFGPAFLGALSRNLGESLVVYAALEHGEPLGVLIALRAGDATFLAFVGVAPGHRESFVYVINAFYEPIKDAIATGVRRIYCGKLAYDVKRRRGFELLELSLYLRVGGRVRAAVLDRLIALQPPMVRRAAGGVEAAP
jgi:predicted N-acyltransferase